MRTTGNMRVGCATHVDEGLELTTKGTEAKVSDRTGVVAPTVEELLVKIDAAHEMVVALCKPRGSEGSREWYMSIPARPDYDPDLVIGEALRLARRYVLSAPVSQLPDDVALRRWDDDALVDLCDRVQWLLREERKIPEAVNQPEQREPDAYSLEWRGPETGGEWVRRGMLVHERPSWSDDDNKRIVPLYRTPPVSQQAPPQRPWTLEDAIAFAAKAHAEQVYVSYSGGPSVPYIVHPLRVMLAIDPLDDYGRMLAVLHDVLEDTSADIPRDAVPMIMRLDLAAISRNKATETYEEYIERVAAARQQVRNVKIADLRDNLSNNPPPGLRYRYERALERLGVSQQAPGSSEEQTRGEVSVIKEMHHDGLGCDYRVRVVLPGVEHHALTTARYRKAAAEMIAEDLRAALRTGVSAQPERSEHRDDKCAQCGLARFTHWQGLGGGLYCNEARTIAFAPVLASQPERVGPQRIGGDSLKMPYEYQPMCNLPPNHSGNHQLRVGDRVIDEWTEQREQEVERGAQ